MRAGRPLLVLIAVVGLVATSGFAAEVGVRRGAYKDPRDCQTYPVVELGGLVWMARNLNYDSRESYCYENRQENCDACGRLYRWEAVLSACPAGWHLSTEYEWQALRSPSAFRSRSWSTGATVALGRAPT